MDKMYENRFPNRLRQLREENGLTQLEMAERLELTFTPYRNFEMGYREMKANLIIRICQMFNCTSDWLLCVSPMERENGDHND